MSSEESRIERLEGRIEQLETAVRELQRAVEREHDVPEGEPPQGGDGFGPNPQEKTPEKGKEPSASAVSDASDAPSRTPQPPAAEGAETEAASTFSVGLRSEDWLSYVGMGLLLFGLAFLFKYSIEQGWLGPPVRVGFGALTGGALLAGGLRLYDERPRLRQVLLGGSSATFYGTVFAAYQLYGLVSYPVAFGSMVAITILSIGLALQQDYASMAVIGTAGGLGTPFLLYADVGGVSGLVVYTCIVLGGAMAVYLYRGWRSLLYTTVAGGWLVLLVPCVDAALGASRPAGAWVLQSGIVVAWLLLGGVPVLRAVLRRRAPDQWPLPPTPVATWRRALAGRRPAYGLVPASPFAALAASRLLWAGSDLLWAGVAGGGALLYGAVYLGLRRESLLRYAPPHGLVAAVLATYALSEVVGGATLLLVWAVEAALLLGLAHRLEDRLLRISGHVIFGIVAVWLGRRFAALEFDALPLVSPGALSELVALGAGVAALRWVRGPFLRRLYQSLLILGRFGWWTNELVVFPQGGAYLLLVGAGSGLVLLWLGRWRTESLYRYAGHAIFGVLVGALSVRLGGSTAEGLPLVGLGALCELAVLGSGLLAAQWCRQPWGRRLYQGAVLVGWLGWWMHELLPVPNGQAYISAAWGTTAVLLLAAGAWHRKSLVQKAGLAVLALFVGKLFFVDLAALSALWRIAMFLGAGGVFLLLSYALPGLGGNRETEGRQ